LLHLDDLKRVGACGQHLAEERIGIQRDGRDQVAQLVRRKQWTGLLLLRRRSSLRLLCHAETGGE
jgi:hypothetical protein